MPALIGVWQFGSAHLAGYRTVIHLGSHLNLRRIVVFSFRPLPVIGQGMLRFAFIPAQHFRGDLSPELEVPAQISRCASGAGGRTCQSDSDPKGWRGVLVWCPLPMLLLAHSERGTEHFFPRPLT
ncbi:hypothetical protein, partial [Candidatus Binatus sp.]|uniref:hypothetical protein n=1 Tax=Candidatus Binatus sp. TaxID=2811406 RepID=UPI003CA9274B